MRASLRQRGSPPASWTYLQVSRGAARSKKRERRPNLQAAALSIPLCTSPAGGRTLDYPLLFFRLARFVGPVGLTGLVRGIRSTAGVVHSGLFGSLTGPLRGRRCRIGGEGFRPRGRVQSSDRVLHDVRLGALFRQPLVALGLPLLGEDRGFYLCADVLEGTDTLGGALGHEDHEGVAHAIVGCALLRRVARLGVGL